MSDLASGLFKEKDKDFLIVANGEFLQKDDLMRLMQDRCVIALDGALQRLLEYQLKPFAVLGDFDSVVLDDISETDYFQGIHVLKLHDQNHTDLDKAIDFVLQHDPKNITICCAQGGGRLDHSLQNLNLLRRHARLNISMTMLTPYSSIYYVANQQLLLTGEKGDNVAILGFPHGRICTDGLDYDSQDLPVDYFGASSICNTLHAEQARVAVDGSVLLIVQRGIIVALRV